MNKMSTERCSFLEMTEKLSRVSQQDVGEHQGQKGGMGGQGVVGVGMGDLWDSIENVNEENT
jgi:hypothetical protein